MSSFSITLREHVFSFGGKWLLSTHPIRDYTDVGLAIFNYCLDLVKVSAHPPIARSTCNRLFKAIQPMDCYNNCHNGDQLWDRINHLIPFPDFFFTSCTVSSVLLESSGKFSHPNVLPFLLIMKLFCSKIKRRG